MIHGAKLWRQALKIKAVLQAIEALVAGAPVTMITGGMEQETVTVHISRFRFFWSYKETWNKLDYKWGRGLF